MIVWALVAVIAVLVGVVVWLLRPGPKRGGMIDLTGVRVDGDIDFEWPERFPPVEPVPYDWGNGDDLRFPSTSRV